MTTQYRSAYRTQPPRNTPLKSLAAKIAVAAFVITGSAGMAVAATSSPAHAAAAGYAGATITPGSIDCGFGSTSPRCQGGQP
jgi:hypothetical protein